MANLFAPYWLYLLRSYGASKRELMAALLLSEISLSGDEYFKSLPLFILNNNQLVILLNWIYCSVLTCTNTPMRLV